MDKNYELVDFALKLERITIEVVMRGRMTQDLSKLFGASDSLKMPYMNTQAFILEV